MKTIDVLKAARAKITNPENWMKGFYAKTPDGGETVGTNPEATCFCALGAIESVTGILHLYNGWPDRAVVFLNKVVKEVQPEDVNYRNVAEYNDNSTHEQVLAVFDKAITLAENEE